MGSGSGGGSPAALRGYRPSRSRCRPETWARTASLPEGRRRRRPFCQASSVRQTKGGEEHWGVLDRHTYLRRVISLHPHRALTRGRPSASDLCAQGEGVLILAGAEVQSASGQPRIRPAGGTEPTLGIQARRARRVLTSGRCGSSGVEVAWSLAAPTSEAPLISRCCLHPHLRSRLSRSPGAPRAGVGQQVRRGNAPSGRRVAGSCRKD